MKNGIIEQIQKEMKQRFPSEPVPTFDSRYRTLPDVILAYAYLNVDVGFEYPYYTYLRQFDFQDSGGSRTGVTAFCCCDQWVQRGLYAGAGSGGGSVLR